jgi:hypothetical protein
MRNPMPDTIFRLATDLPLLSFLLPAFNLSEAEQWKSGSQEGRMR